jgi:hypothetical protein
MAKYIPRIAFLASVGKKQETVDIPIVSDGGGITVAADALGTPEFAHSEFTALAQTLAQAGAAELILDYAWAATADGTIQLYDVTGATVVAETTAKVGGESSEREVVSVPVANLTAGNTLRIRANITTAGAAGEVATLYRATLRIVVYAIGANQTDAEIYELNSPVKGLIHSIRVYCTALTAAASVTVKKNGTAITAATTPTAGTESIVEATDPFINQGDVLTVHVTTDAAGSFTDLSVTIIIKQQEDITTIG